MAGRNDAGLADPYWRRYFSSEEVAEIEAATVTTGLLWRNIPIHLRIYDRGRGAPTLVAAHGLLLYGLLCARLHLELFRAGWTVVAVDFPGFGQSGGARGAESIDGMIGAWRAAIEWAANEAGAPVTVLGVAEDGVPGYYAAANNDAVVAMSFHHLVEFGDFDNTAFLGPHWLQRVLRPAAAVAAPVAPWVRIGASARIYDSVFSMAEDAAARELLRRDPMAVTRFSIGFGRDLVRRRPPPVRFEDCRTPTQLITSAHNRIWRTRINERTFERLGCEKEHVVIDRDHWSLARPFVSEYAAHATRFFEGHKFDSCRGMSDATNGRAAS